MKKHQRRTRKTHKKVYPKITNNQNIGLRHKNGKRYAVLLGATNQPIVNRTTNKVNLYDYKTAINKHRLKKLSSYSPQFNPQGGEVKRNRKKTKKTKKKKTLIYFLSIYCLGWLRVVLIVGTKIGSIPFLGIIFLLIIILCYNFLLYKKFSILCSIHPSFLFLFNINKVMLFLGS